MSMTVTEDALPRYRPLADFLDGFSMSRTEFYRRESAGEIKAVRRGRRVFISESEWLAFANRGEQD